MVQIFWPLSSQPLPTASGAIQTAGELGTRPRFVLADAEKYITVANSGDLPAALLVRTQLEEKRCALAFGYPVGCDRCARREEFFNDDESGKGRAASAAVSGRQHQADEPGHSQLAAELCIATHP